MATDPKDAIFRLEKARQAAPDKEAQRKQAIDTFFSKLQNKYASTKDERLAVTLARRKHKQLEPDLPRVKPVYRQSPEAQEAWKVNTNKKIDDPGRRRARDARMAHEQKGRSAGRSPGLKDYLANDFMKGWNKIKAIKPGELPDLD